MIQCDFDSQLIGGKAVALLRSHDTQIRADLPHPQDINGLFQCKW